MTFRRRTALAAAAALAALALPTAALAHAYLLRTAPAASVVLNRPPAQLALTYNETVEPRFAIVSVTDAGGHAQTTGRPQRSSADAHTIVTPLRHVPEGWYLVYWRAISADGHPVRGAFTFAVGPNPGPPPQFVIPSLTETATTPGLLTFRWLVFLSMMIAIGLLVLRLVIARPVVERVPGASLRRVPLAFAIALGAALVFVPVYVEIATAQFALKSVFDVGAVVPLMRTAAFGRAFLDLELVLALLAVAGAIAIANDRPEQRRRTTAGLLSLTGALACAAAALLVPGLAGHAAQTKPKGLSVLLDWLHLAAGSVWIGGLAGLLVLWWSLGRERRTPALAVCVTRFSRVAFVSVAVLIGTGIGASLIRLPTFGSLWQTSYGTALIAKISLLLTAMPLAAINLTRTRPRLQAAAPGAAGLLRRTVSGEVALIAGALFAAAILTSLPPPPKALASLGHASAHVGPGSFSQKVEQQGYELQFRVTPNKAAVPNSFSVRITKGGKPVRGADVTASFTMLDMEMPQLAYHLPEQAPGVFARSAPALVMVGRWGLEFQVTPPGRAPFNVLLVDRANG